MKTTIVFFVMAILAVGVLHAKIWTVDNNPGNSAADFTSLATAVADGSVQSGDTIYVAGSSLTYSASVTLTKKLYIFGPGYFLSENLDLQANTAAATITGTFSFNSGSQGSIAQGLTFTNQIVFNISNITFRRNRLNIGYFSFNSSISNIIIVQNYCVYNYCCGPQMNVGANNTNIIIANNFFEQTGGGGIMNVPTGATAYVTNNIFKAPASQTAVNLNGATGSFDNNILYDGTFNSSAIVHRNNISNSTQFGTANGNQENVTMSTVFALSGTPDAQWQVLTAGPADDAGLSGEDCGMFGGNSPYVLSGLPPIPSIYFMSAPISGSAAQGLPVTIKVKSHN